MNDYPVIYILVQKTDYGKQFRTYIRMNMEITIFQENSLIPLNEKVYQFGKFIFKNEDTINTFKLQTNEKKKIWS
jgi:hypothetical protein